MYSMWHVGVIYFWCVRMNQRFVSRIGGRISVSMNLNRCPVVWLCSYYDGKALATLDSSSQSRGWAINLGYGKCFYVVFDLPSAVDGVEVVVVLYGFGLFACSLWTDSGGDGAMDFVRTTTIRPILAYRRLC